MIKKNVHESVENENKSKSFLEKYKTDKKYKAKVELIGYGILIVVLIIYLNVASMTSSPGSVGNVVTDSNFTGGVEEENTSLDDTDWLENIRYNYEYSIQVSMKVLDEGVEVDNSFQYSGKRYQEEIVIDKQLGDVKNTYYKIGSMYYQNAVDGYSLIEEEDIYDLIGKEYVELDEVREYLEMASLDHVTDYSSGKTEYVYHLKVRDVIKTYTEDDVIEFSVVSLNGVLSMEVDYSNLVKAVDKDVVECKMKYSYQNIGKVEEFHTVISEESMDS